MRQTTLEVCVDSVQSAINAQAGGADRIELCSNLVLGGVTPGKQLYQLVREYTDIEVRVLLRPRYGDYYYDAYEFEQLKEEVQMYRELGADGVVIGVLTPGGSLNIRQMQELIKLAGDMDTALHRAFDVCRDPFAALEEAIYLGMDTILTSGQHASAWEGRELLKALVEKSRGQIEILAGAGVNAEVIEKLRPFTGGTSYHMSGKTLLESSMTYRHPDVCLDTPGGDDYVIWQTSEEKVRQAARVLGKTLI